MSIRNIDRSRLADTPATGLLDVSVVMPCLNEAETLASCVRTALDTIEDARVTGEVLVVDNGSTDGSQEIAAACGARVVTEERRGYGSALRRGCDEARGRVILIADADGSYDTSQLPSFLAGIGDGADLVIGSRLRGTIMPGAMPWKNRYIGNPLLTTLLNQLFGTRVSDVHCGMRAFTNEAYRRMRLRSTGMEFASEMVIKAATERMRIQEVPITFLPDGRSRRPHLRPWRDGWRHLKLIMLLSPTALFLIPGLVLCLLGVTLMTIQLVAPMQAPMRFAGFRMDFHWAILGSLLAIVGFQIILVNFFAKVYAVTHGIRSADRLLERAFAILTLERVLAVSSIAILAGLVLDGWVAIHWLRSDLGPLVSGYTRMFIFGSTSIALGVQTFFSAFFFSILGDDYPARAR